MRIRKSGYQSEDSPLGQLKVWSTIMLIMQCVLACVVVIFLVAEEAGAADALTTIISLLGTAYLVVMNIALRL